VEVSDCRFSGVKLISPGLKEDRRGYFSKVYISGILSEHGVKANFKEVFFSYSQKGVIRGLHYQLKPMAQGKFVFIVEGKVLDVILDIRKESPTFGEWCSITLTNEGIGALWIPEGFAHGFAALSEKNYLVYIMTENYSPEKERGIAWNDPYLNIDWPFNDPIMSERDSHFPSFKEADTNF